MWPVLQQPLFSHFIHLFGSGSLYLVEMPFYRQGHGASVWVFSPLRSAYDNSESAQKLMKDIQQQHHKAGGKDKSI